MAWVDRAAAATAIKNDRTLIHWNADKSYLSELARRGVPIVPTISLRQGEAENLAVIAATYGWRDLVIKPSRGAAAHDVLFVPHGVAGLASGQAHIDRLTRYQNALVQPYLRNVVSYGERALIFLEGRFSHAVLKRPFDTLLVVSNARSALVEATSDEVHVATHAISSVPGEPLYARVDLLRGDSDEIYVSEVELIEPALYLRLNDMAPSLFADAIERALTASARKQKRPPPGRKARAVKEARPHI
jgi:glutathione synthase/RimK-type ligase-like ATP-grasp enzyme